MLKFFFFLIISFRQIHSELITETDKSSNNVKPVEPENSGQINQNVDTIQFPVQSQEDVQRKTSAAWTNSKNEFLKQGGNENLESSKSFPIHEESNIVFENETQIGRAERIVEKIALLWKSTDSARNVNDLRFFEDRDNLLFKENGSWTFHEKSVLMSLSGRVLQTLNKAKALSDQIYKQKGKIFYMTSYISKLKENQKENCIVIFNFPLIPKEDLFSYFFTLSKSMGISLHPKDTVCIWQEEIKNLANDQNIYPIYVKFKTMELKTNFMRHTVRQIAQKVGRKKNGTKFLIRNKFYDNIFINDYFTTSDLVLYKKTLQLSRRRGYVCSHKKNSIRVVVNRTHTVLVHNIDDLRAIKYGNISRNDPVWGVVKNISFNPLFYRLKDEETKLKYEKDVLIERSRRRKMDMRKILVKPLDPYHNPYLV